jgi:hypothetical protein
MQLTIDLPKHPIGTQFTYNPNGKQKHAATIVGYHIEHNTDDGRTRISYRAQYNFADMQIMTVNVPPAMVDRALFAEARS